MLFYFSRVNALPDSNRSITASYGGVRSGDPHAIGRRIRELCWQYGTADRMPRPVIPGDKWAL